MQGFLSNRYQKLLKWCHVIFVCFALGGTLSILTLVYLKRNFPADVNLFLIDVSAYQIFNIVVMYAFYGLIISALLYSLFTKWGFFKHHWITVKWIGVVIAFAFVWLMMGPAINGMAALADGEFILPDSLEMYQTYTLHSFWFTIAMGGLFVFIILISVFKPWGVRKKQAKMKRGVILILVGILFVFATLSIVMQSVMLHSYRTMEIKDSELSALADGDHEGEVSLGGFTYKVSVTVEGGAIADIVIQQNRTSPYAKFAEGVIPKIIEAQNANVDVITGATTTSKALMKAVEKALQN